MFGFDSLTSLSRSSSVLRRFTKVVFALRSVLGSSSSARWRATFSSPMARIAEFVLLTSSVRSPRRDGDRRDRVGAVLDELLEHLLVERQLLGQPRRASQEGPEVLDALAGLDAAAVVLGAGSADEVAQARARLGVQRVEERVEVHRRAGLVGADLAAVLELVRVVRPRLQRDVAARDARQRGRADRRRGALVQRGNGVADLHGHDRVRPVVQLDVGDRADRLPAHAHLVAGHELAGVLEDRLDLVLVAAPEHRQGGQRDGSDQRRKRQNSRHG